MANLIVEAVPPSQTGEATGVNTLIRSVGASLGSQVTAAILAGAVLAGTAFPEESGFTAAYLVCAGVAGLAAVFALMIPRGAHSVVRARGSAAGPGGAMSAAEPAVELAKRSDAVRNRLRVLAAAEAVFAERGIEAGVPEIAERAGVGKATVYRSFPTKEHLIAAVSLARLEDFEQRVRARLDAPDAWQALHDLMRRQRRAPVRGPGDHVGAGERRRAGAARRRPRLDVGGGRRSSSSAPRPRGGSRPTSPPRTCACSGRAPRASSPPTATATPRPGAATPGSCSARCRPEPPARPRAPAPRRSSPASAGR